MTAVLGQVDTVALRARYATRAASPDCPRCGRAMRLDTGVRGHCAPPVVVYRCIVDNAWLSLPVVGDADVLRLVEAYEGLVEQVRVRPL